MKQKLLFLQPIFHEKIWGGLKLRQTFNYDIPSDHTGECWAISAHQNGDCLINNGDLKGYKLSEVYKEYRYLFNNCESRVFPLLTKILDANHDLSVQVHPDDSYALEHELELGKTECWYILDCSENGSMIFGHYAKTKEELKTLIEKNEWDQLLRKVKIKPGDFFYVPSGTIHALCEGTLVLETQQSSDTTYRVYDYNRLDDKKEPRDLHIKQALEVTTTPHQDTIYQKQVQSIDQSTITTFVKTQFFTVEKWDVKGHLERENNTFLLVSVLNGTGQFLDASIKKGDHFIVTSINKTISCTGNFELMVSYL